nr:isopeptide-forming domain-containing fimbrial protein [Patulibacter sp. SYSU D01012]
MVTGDSSATTDIAALEITKDEPSPEGEIVRGVHDHQTVYTLRVRNNGVRTTTGIAVDDYLPAGLEFLGCGQVDHTTSAGTNPGSDREYDGAPTLAGRRAAPADCVAPALVETVRVDPDGAGPLPLAVYTHVRWNALGQLAAGDDLTIRYLAAVPIRENTLDWATGDATTGGATPATTGAQAANLGNNSGPETTDEQPLTNLARAAGVYRGDDADPARHRDVEDTTTLTRTAEDVAVQKSVDRGDVAQDAISRWTFDVQTSEYRTVRDIVVDDVLPNGLCPLGATNLEGGGQRSTECDPVAGEVPTLPYASTTERADGTWALRWNVPDMGASDTYSLRFSTRTRRFYQQDFADDTANPVRTGDSWTNRITLTANDFRRIVSGQPVPGDEADGTQDVDASAASQETNAVTIDKTVLGAPGKTSVPTAADCATLGAYGDATPRYAPGDRVCWKLRVDFASQTDSGTPIVRDFLPPGFAYEAGSARTTADNTVAGVPAPTVDGDTLTWSLADVPTGGKVFDVVIATRVEKQVADVAGQITGNLMKLSFRNTAGTTFPRRDRVEVQREDALLALRKGVAAVDGVNDRTFAPPAKDVTVSGGDAVTYAVDVRNDGARDAVTAEVWDRLPAGITCADVVPTSISAGGACADGALGGDARIRWTGVDVDAGDSVRLTYVVRVPTTFAPAHVFTNTAGVVTYGSPTNVGGGDTFTYVPQDNIDPTKTSPNAERADDTATIRTPNAAVAKRQATSITATGNNGPDQATIGERIQYEVDVRVPAGTTIYGDDPALTDPLGRRVTVEGTPTVTQSGGTAATPTASVTGDPTAGQGIRLAFGGPYANAATTDAVFTVRFTVIVDDDAGTFRSTSGTQNASSRIQNTATLAYDETAAGTPVTRPSNTTTATIVEPNLGLAKTVQGNADGVLSPDEVVRYRLAITNAGSNVTISRDSVVTDTLPVDLLPLTPGGALAADGDPVGTDGTPGTWNAAARTITWTVGDIAPGATPTRTFDVRVKSPPAAGANITNTARVTGSSLAGASADERSATSPVRTTGYVATGSLTLPIAGGTLTKRVDRPTATVGDPLTYTLEYTLPANLRFNDLTVLDTLPDGVALDPDVTPQITCVSCTLGAANPSTPTVLGPRDDASGTTTVGFYLGDVPDATQARTVRVTFGAYVEDAYAAAGGGTVDRGDVLTNRATVHYDDDAHDQAPPTDVPAPGDYTSHSDEATASTTVIAPRLTVNKDVAGQVADTDVRTVDPAQDVTYTVTVRNTGDADAYDVDASDTLNPRLRDVALVGTTPAGETRTLAGGALAWRIDRIPAGGSASLQYTAKVAPSSELTQSAQIANMASVPSYWEAPKATRDEHAPPRAYVHHTETPPDVVTLDVTLPAVHVEKTTGAAGLPETADAQVGEGFPWRIVVTNPGRATAHDVRVTDTLPAGWTYQAGSAAFASTPGGIAPAATEPTVAGRDLTWADIGDVPAGGQVVLTLRAVPGLAARGAANPQQNAVAVAATDASGASASQAGPYADDDTAGANLRLPTLEVTKTPDGADVTAGTTGTYTVRVRNTSTDAPAREVVVTDTLGTDQTYTAGSATATPATGFAEASSSRDATSGVTTTEWRIAAIPAGGSVDIAVPVAVAASAPAGTALTNGASVVSREVTTPATDDGSLTPRARADVGIVKTASAPRATAGGEVAYTLKVTNHGPSDATGVEVADDLPAALTAVSAPGCTVADGRQIRCAVGALAAGASTERTVTAKIASGATGTVRNVATVRQTTGGNDPANDASAVDVTLDAAADVAVTKTVDRAQVPQGQDVRYAITVENTGVSDATDVVLEDPVPAGLRVVGTPAGCDVAGNAVRCELGTMVPGAKRTFEVVARAVDAGATTNVATVTTPTAQTDTTNDRDDADVTVLPVADLSVEKTAAAQVAPDGTLDYALTVRNAGPSDATGVVLTDTLPAGLELVGLPAGCAASGTTVTCAIGDLASGDERVVAVRTHVPYALAGTTITNVASVRGDQLDTTPENDGDDATTTVGPAADLSIAKTAGGAIAGGAATWTITVRNAGPSTATGVTVRDALPEGTAFRAAAPSQGACRADGRDVTCELGDLPSGGSAQIAVAATVDGGLTGATLRNVAEVTGREPDPKPGDERATADVVVQRAPAVQPRLRVTKVASTTAPRLGGEVTYRVVVENVGEVRANDVRMTDTMNAPVRIGRVTPTQGTCRPDGASAIGCSLGALEPGQRVTVTTTVTPLRAGGLRNTATVQAVGQVLQDPAGATAGAGTGAVADVRVGTRRTRVGLTKRASRSVVRGGETVTFTIRATMPKRVAGAGVRVCDRLPDGLTYVRAKGATFRRGQACWTVGYLAPGRTRTFRIVARAERSGRERRVRNRAVVTGDNVVRRTASARVRITPAALRADGGVTG